MPGRRNGTLDAPFCRMMEAASSPLCFKLPVSVSPINLPEDAHG